MQVNLNSARNGIYGSKDGAIIAVVLFENVQYLARIAGPRDCVLIKMKSAPCTCLEGDEIVERCNCGPEHELFFKSPERVQQGFNRIKKWYEDWAGTVVRVGTDEGTILFKLDVEKPKETDDLVATALGIDALDLHAKGGKGGGKGGK